LKDADESYTICDVNSQATVESLMWRLEVEKGLPSGATRLISIYKCFSEVVEM